MSSPTLARGARSVHAADCWTRLALARRRCRRRTRIRVGRLTVVLPDGSVETFGDRRPPSGAPRSTSTTARRWPGCSLGGETGAGEAYMDGLWSSPDLPALLRLAARNREALALSGGWWRVPAPAAADARAPRAAQHARRQPPQHRRALRPGQRLLPAVPRRDDDLLERRVRLAGPVARRRAAQQVPAHRGQGAGLRAGEHVLEIGTGWGGFALYAAGELGCRVTTITISQEQYELARERVRAAGLDDLVDVQLRDYRDVEGTYDAIVSIEMLEAVGAEYLAHVLRGLRSRAATGRPAEPPGRSRSPMPRTSASSGARTGSRPTSSRAGCAPRSR